MTTPQPPQAGGFPPPPLTGPYGTPAPPPAIPAAAGRPGILTGAAVLALVVGGLSVIFGLMAFGWIALIGGAYLVYALLALVAAAGLIWGGIQALGGKDGRVIVIAAAGAVAVNLIGMIMYFTASSLIGLILPVLIVVLMVQPQSRAWITARGGRVF